MDSSLIPETLTDGSKVYSVAFVDGSAVATVHCYDEKSARALQGALADLACFATIDDRRAAA